MLVRAESPDEENAINALTQRAFAPMPFSDQREAEIVRALRRDSSLTLSLVAVEEGEVVGHVAFSPITINGVQDDWFGLGPISVRRSGSGRGSVGRALVRTGLESLQARAASGCALIGNAEIYRRFGFVSDGQLRYADIPAHLATLRLPSCTAGRHHVIAPVLTF